jgi:predicted GNAT family N-acyltransferase
MQLREIIYNTEEYTLELELRDKVLRKPLGMSLYDENRDAEKNDIHVGAFHDNQLVGVLILTRLAADSVKMRQVAVDEPMQSMKVGTQLVRFAEEFSKNKGYAVMVLNARKTVVGFYEKQGYEKVGEEFLEINIPHFKMKKSLL